MRSDSLINCRALNAFICERVFWVAWLLAQVASIGGGSFSGGAKARTKPTVADLQNGGQDGPLCLKAEKEERSD